MFHTEISTTDFVVRVPPQRSHIFSHVPFPHFLLSRVPVVGAQVMLYLFHLNCILCCQGRAEA